ncbi:uncharacterized protein HGUI_02259 [Hanseniaspora guilliermondii]|uniref:C2H2-type domain-containing protein n=1 Tax=Hanseniaspora guilliermondii TaxID=56406 RepID=A0A1L0B4U5_9ASCO|nr:uncharacterized protein HGUI_02259 [Hanseniaspora guilliermondii]
MSNNNPNKNINNSDIDKIQNDNIDEQLLLANTLTSLSRGSSPISHNQRNSHSPLVALLNKPNEKFNSPLPSISTISNNQNTSITQNNRNNSIMSTTSSVNSTNSMLFPPPSPNLLFFNPSNRDTFNNGTIPGPLGNVFPTSFSQKKDDQNKIPISSSTQMLSINNPIQSSVSTPINSNLFFSKNLSVDTPPLGTLHNIKYPNLMKKNDKSKQKDINDPSSKKSSKKKSNFTNNVCQLPGSGISYSPQVQINSYYNNPSTLTNNLYNIQGPQSNSNLNFNSLMNNNVEGNFFLNSDSPLPNLQNNQPSNSSYTGINSLLHQNPQLFSNMGRPRSPRQVNLKINTAPVKFDSLTPMALTPDIDNEIINMKRKNTDQDTRGTKKVKTDKTKPKNGVKKRKKKKNIDDFSYMTQPSSGILYKVRLRDLIKELHPTKEEILEEDHTIQPQEVIQDEKGNRKYRCIHCMKFFQSGHHLTRHKTSVHSMLKLFECLRCGKQFKRKDHAWQHVCKKLSCPFLENAEEDLFSKGVICEEGDIESD